MRSLIRLYFLLLLAFVSTLLLNSSVQASNYEEWSDDTLCSWGTTYTNGVKVFKRAFAGMPEVNKRGLSCDIGSKLPAKYKTVKRSPLHKSFISLSKAERSKIQSALADLNLYTSSIDGLYGRGTAAALKQYNEQYANVGNLAKQSNANKILALILESTVATVDTNSEPEDVNTPSTVVTTKKQAPKPKTVADLTSHFKNQDYKTALEIAQDLAVAGDAEAQAYLGKMYADGLGTLQLSKNAHMWFNIASLNGSQSAVEGRNAVASTMSQDAVNEAQDMALKCIQSNYADCGLLVKKSASVSTAPKASRSIESGDVLISDFKVQSSLRRKQLQYALKKLGLYSSTVDGLWGSNTSKAFTNYIKVNELVAQEAEDVFTSILSKVNVPSSFASTRSVSKPRVAPKPSKPTYRVPSGWRLVTNNPQHSFEQSNAICKPMSENAGSSAKQFKMDSNSFNCFGNSYSVNCSESSGGFAEGFAESFVTGMNRKKARKRAYASCMAQYGWVER